ncbi:MAG: alpha-glucosidase C-terminal domain-containing protein [Pseudomonadota bacterium]
MLWNGKHGAPMVEVPNSASDDVLSFVRGQGSERVFGVFNLSPRAHSVTFETERHHGRFADTMSGEEWEWGEASELDLPAWGYRIFTAN